MPGFVTTFFVNQAVIVNYSEYTRFDEGSRAEAELFAPRPEAEPSLFDRHVKMESLDRGFDFRTWQMLVKLVIVVCGVLFFGWFCTRPAPESDTGEPGIVRILKSDQ